MADSRDITGKNRKFKGTSGIVLPKGTQAQRADTESGELRFNTDTNLAEYYDGTEWKPIDAPPTLTDVSPASPVDDGSTNTTITLTGSNLQDGGSLKLIGDDATEYTVSSFTRVSSSSITFTYTSALAAAGVNTPYDVRYENPSGLAATLEDSFTPNTTPEFQTASGSLGTINIGANASTLTQISVTDTSGGTLVYSISAGALPSGASINSGTGAISGVVDTAETANFTVQVTDGTNTVTRAFSATIINPYVAATGGTITESGDFKIHTFTGDGTFTVTSAGNPVGSTTVDYLVIAGGAGGGSSEGGGGGGAGGYRHSFPNPATGGLPVSVQAYPVSVGSGGAGPAVDAASGIRGLSGNPSSFSTITSAGGGGGGGGAGAAHNPGNAGGSGGGGAARQQVCASINPPGGANQGGAGNTPSVSPPQGNPGGNSHGEADTGRDAGGGGGGAGAAGATTSTPTPTTANSGAGGAGAASSITGSSVTRAGGGGGGSCACSTFGPGGSGGGGAGGPDGVTNAGVGSVNTGSGGGGGSGPGKGSKPGDGGSGIVIIRYKFQ
jgi:hypothetical protein